MDVLYPRCAGLDVHKDTVVACVRCVSSPPHRETRSVKRLPKLTPDRRPILTPLM